MTQINNVINGANNDAKDGSGEHALDQKSNLITEPLQVTNQGTIQEKDESKSNKEECDGKDTKDHEKTKNVFDTNLVIRIMGFPRLRDSTEEEKLYYTFFRNEIAISAPLVEMSTRPNESVIFQLKSEEDKKILFSKIKKYQIYKWRNYKLKSHAMPPMLLGKEYNKMPLDEALQLLFPYNGIPYRKQLEEKTKILNEIIDSILPDKPTNVTLKPIVPMTSIEGYDYQVSFGIEEDYETKRIVYGIRVTSTDTQRTSIVPIDQCPNVPHQMTLVVKDFIDHMPEFGFYPFNYKAVEGNILGITLQMTQSGNFIMSLILPTTNLEEFRQLTPHGAEEDAIAANNLSITNETKESMTEKADNYFKKRGKENGVLSVYMNIVNPKSGLEINSADSTVPEPCYILGDRTIPDNYNGQQVRMTWMKDYSINNVRSIMSILNIIQDKGYINSSSAIYLVSNLKTIVLHLANKVETLNVMCSSKRGHLVTMKNWAKVSIGLNNIQFIDVKQDYSPYASSYNNATAIIWHSIKKPVVQKLLACGINNIIFVSSWTKDPSTAVLIRNKESLKDALQRTDILNIIPVDIAPYTQRCGLIIFLRAKNYLMTRKRGYDEVDVPYLYYEDQTKRFKPAYY